MMNMDQTFALIAKEMEYQRRVFGDYKDIKALNLASHLIFQESYLKRAKDAYVQKWSAEIPSWMLSCTELQLQNEAPILTYEAIIKNAALNLSCLKSHLDADPIMWRADGRINDKWMDK